MYFRNKIVRFLSSCSDTSELGVEEILFETVRFGRLLLLPKRVIQYVEQHNMCCHHIHVYHRSYQILLTKTVTQRRWRRRRRRRPSRMKINNCLEKYEIWYKQFLLFYAGRFTLPTLNMFLKLAHGLNVRLKSCKTCLYMLAFQTSFLLFSVFSNNNTIFSANKC